MTEPDLVALLRAAVARATRTEPGTVGEDSSLRALGVNSMRAMRIAANLERQLGAPVAPWPLLEHDRLGDAAAAITPGTPAAPESPPERGTWRPLSHAEQAQWYLDWSEPGSTRYVFSGAIRLRGPLDPGALRDALTAIVRRHEPLRTRYELGPDRTPRALACPPYPVDLPVTDTDAPDLAVRDERDTPFDLAGGRLLRARLLRLAPADHVLILAAHHIAVDGWSLGVLLRELGGASPALRAGYPDAVATEAATWRDDGPSRLRWWRDYLAGAPTALDVPGDLPGEPGAAGPGRVLRFTLDEPLARAVRALPATPFVALFSAYAVVLHRRGGRDDLLVGTPLANRVRPDYHDLVGMFVNTVVLRSRLDVGTTFADLLRANRDGLLGAMTHQDVPMPAIVAAAGAARDAGRDPLVRVMFDLHSFPPGELRLPGVAVSAGDGSPLSLNSFETPGSQAKFDLTLTMEDTGEALLGALEYRTDRYGERWAAGFVDELLGVLAEATRDPDVRVRELGADRGEPSIVHGPPAPSGGLTVHELITANRGGAVIDGDRVLDHAELCGQAEALAERLRGLGVGAGTTVAVLAERSAGLVVDVLAVLMAGGAFLPLDPRHPVDRMRAMLADGDAAVLLTRDHLSGRIGGDEQDLGTGRRLIPLRPRPSARRDAGPADTAYVLFTSGSTGRPKGVAVSHRSLVTAALGFQLAYGLGEGDVVAQIAGCAFDVFCGELVRGLCTGASLAIVPDDVVLDPARLHALLCDAEVTCAEFVPSVLLPVLDLGRELPSLRTVAIGVEPWSAGEQARLRALLRPDAVVHNTYGLTEATIDSTGEVLPADVADLPPDHRFPVGRPRAGTSVYVLDERGRPVSAGVPGEVWIGGAGVAQGYVGRAAHTADRFRPDPFAAGPGARMYRTGDRARLLPGGRLSLMGRLDRQHKIRGTRVDLEEVEAVLAGAPGVRRAVVVPEPAGLVAYLVREPGTEPRPRQVATHAARWLTRSVCPVRYAVLDRPPLTPNGKIDLAALAEVPATPVAAAGSPRPASATEREVARLCAEVIESEPVGAVDPAADFFELGGHSLLLARWIGLVRDRFAVDLPIREVLLRPTVARVAELVESGAPGASRRSRAAGHTRIRWTARPQRGGDDARP